MLARVMAARGRWSAGLGWIGSAVPDRLRSDAARATHNGGVPGTGEAVLVVPELEAPRVEPVPGVFRSHPWGETEDPIAIVSRVSLVGPDTAMVGDHTWAVFVLALQQALPQTRFRSARPLTEALRIIKEPAEIELLRRAGAQQTLWPGCSRSTVSPAGPRRRYPGW